MKRILHIGCMKCASKAFQQTFMTQHPEVHPLGIWVRTHERGMQINWHDDAWAKAIEIDMRFRNTLTWDPEPVRRQLVDLEGQLARDRPDARALALSYENLSITYTHEQDAGEKARRLHQVFGGDETLIVLIVRDQLALIRSLYKEQLASGAAIGFSDYVDFLINTRYRSVLDELRYDLLVDTYERLFGEGSVFVWPLEWMDGPPRFLDKLAERAGLTPAGIDMPREHGSLAPEQLYLLLQLNRKAATNFGGDHFHLVHGWRLNRSAAGQEPGIRLDERHFADEVLRSALVNAAASRGQQLKKRLSLDYTDWQERFLRDLYGPGNARLAERLGVRPETLGYPAPQSEPAN
jgi:hypothetical protein